eukprot:5118811-Pyramimonas_sp.AAC.2
MERKHRVLKRMANLRFNTTSYEDGLMEDATLQHLFDLRVQIVGLDLLEPRPASKKMRTAIASDIFLTKDCEVMTSKSAFVHSRIVQMGDTVAFCNESGSVGFGQLYFHSRVNGRMLSCVSPWKVLSMADNVARCVVENVPTLMSTEFLLEPCISEISDEGQISEVLFPPKLRLRHSRRT